MDAAVKFYDVAQLVATDLPGKSILDPKVRFFDLTALHYFLLEYSVCVANSVSPNRVIPDKE
jgi:hypothetical protein